MSGNGTFVRNCLGMVHLLECQGTVHLLEYVTSIRQYMAEQQDSYTKRSQINAQNKQWNKTSLIKLIYDNNIFISVPMHKTPLLTE